MRVLRQPGAYLIVAALGVAAMLGVSLFGASTLGITYVIDLTALVVLAVMVVVWLADPSPMRTAPGQIVFLAAGFVAWAVGVVLFLTRGTATQPAVMVVGVLLGLSILKAPPRTAAVRAMDALVWGVVASSLVALLLEIAGARPSWYGLLGLNDLLAYERDTYWVPLADLLGLDARWAGPFDHPGRAGQAAAITVVWGLTRRGTTRIVLSVAGLTMLLLADSSTGYLAAALGVCALGIGLVAARHGRRMSGTVIAASLLLGLLAILLIVGPNMGLTGRTSIWPVYVDLWRSAPWTGIGESGIGAAQANGLLPGWAYHAHNSWLDLLTRSGLVAAAAGLVATVTAAVLGWRRAGRGDAAPWAVIATVLVGALAQPTLVWSGPTVSTVALVLAVLATGADERGDGAARAGDRMVRGPVRRGWATRGRGAPAAGRSRGPDRRWTDGRGCPAASSGAAGPS